MSLGTMTRQSAELRAADQLNTALQALWNVDMLRDRVAAELAAGTLDTWYGDNTTDKANFVGALDQAHAIWEWLNGGGDVTAPAGDPLAYIKFLTGNA